MKLLLIISTLALALALAQEEEENPKFVTLSPEVELQPDKIITNGFSAPDGHSPYIVSIAINIPNSQNMGLCSGSIIGNTWVLTAAHCLMYTPYVDVFYGSNWRWHGQFSHRLARHHFLIHNLYPAVYGNDIALIRTPHINFSSRVNKINLPPIIQRDITYTNWSSLACGWGAMSDGRLAEWLQCVDVQIMSNDECSQSYGEVMQGTMCIRTTNGRSTCGGDSGGPLTTHYNTRLVGITSFGPSTGCTEGKPAAFTRLSYHLDWIRRNTGIYYEY